MGRKRKSELISGSNEIDLVDLTTTPDTDKNAFISSNSRHSGSGAKPLATVDQLATGHRDNSLQSSFNLARAVSQASHVLDNAARAIRTNNQQTPDQFQRDCTACKDSETRCDLQRPICGRCQKLRAYRPLLNCSFAQDARSQAGGSRFRPIVSAVQAGPKEVEVADLESDDDKDDSSHEEEYEVGSIVKRGWGTKTGVRYYVKWKGYSSEANTWEPLSNLGGAQALIDEFELNRAEGKKPSLPKSVIPENLTQSVEPDGAFVRHDLNEPKHQAPRRIPEDVANIHACRLISSDMTYEYCVEWRDHCPIRQSWEPEDRFIHARRWIELYHLPMCDDFELSPWRDVDTIEHKGTGRTPGRHPFRALAPLDDQKFFTETQLIITSRRIPPGSKLAYCIWDEQDKERYWTAGSDLRSGEGREALLAFMMRSKIMKDCLDPGLKKAQSYCRIRVPFEAKTTNSRTETNPRVLLLKPDTFRLFKRTPEVEAVIDRKAAKGNVTMYLVQWKGSQKNTWELTEDLYRVPGGVVATGWFLAGIAPNSSDAFISPADESVRCSYPYHGSDSTASHGVGVDGTYWFRHPDHPSARRNLQYVNPPPPYFHDACVLCNILGVGCESVGSCRRCASKGRICIRPEYTAAQNQAVGAWQQSRQPSDLLLKGDPWERLYSADPGKSTREVLTHGRMPPHLLYGEKPMEGTAWEHGSVIFKTQGKDMPGWDSMDNASYQVGPPNDAEHAAIQSLFNAVETSANKVSDVQEASTRGANIQWPTDKQLDQNHPKWRRGPKSRQKFSSSKHKQELSVREGTGNIPIAPKTPDKTTLESSATLLKRPYSADEQYLIVQKGLPSGRPLPRGYYRHDNVASNVLLTIGKHPWLPGLNHHLKGLLDRADSGRRLNHVTAQIRRSADLRQYQAPSTFVALIEANFRASLPMGGKAL